MLAASPKSILPIYRSSFELDHSHLKSVIEIENEVKFTWSYLFQFSLNL
jgi:hypothetical protein